MEKLFIIKIGGNIIDSESASAKFLDAFSKVPGKKILVHGGGKIATRIGEKLGIEAKYVDGRRITNDATLDLVTMVYGGLINKKIVAHLQAFGCNAIGLTGADGNIIPAYKRPVKTIDYGWAGDVKEEEVNVAILKRLLDAGLAPVCAPLTHDKNGNMLNTNADTIASALAVALSAHYEVRLLFCFEKKGVLETIDDDISVIRRIDKITFEKLKEEGRLHSGILPKIENALRAVDKGVKSVIIGHADDLEGNILDTTLGTKIE
jgi:acetylglutamate kinase